MQIPRLHKETALFSATRKISSSFEVLAESITSLVEGEETYTGPDGETHVSAFGTLLKQTANNILIKATKSASSAADVGSSIISSFINVAPESIKIAASHVDIEGAAIFKSGGKLAKVVKASSTQWYSSTSATQRTGGSWSTNQPAVTAGRYIWQRTYYEYTDDTTGYKPSEGGVCVTAPTDISGAQSRSQVIYRSAASGTGSMASNLTWVTEAGDVQNKWTTTRPTYASGYPVLFVATQSQTVSQRQGTSCACTTPVKDTTTTVIDGGNIATGTVDATALKANTLQITNFSQEDQRVISDRVTNEVFDASVAAIRAQLATSSSSASSASKAASCAGFELRAGASVSVKFGNRNTVRGTLTLNVNSTGAKSIYVNGSAASSSNNLLWATNAVITFTYDGNYWQVVHEPRTWFGKCSTAAATAEKTDASKIATGAVICCGTVVNVTMASANTAAYPKLNIGGTGALDIHAEDARVASDSPLNWTEGATVAFTFNGTCWDFDATGGRKYAQALAVANGSMSRAQTIFRQAASGTNTMAPQTTWVTAVDESVNVAKTATHWTTKRPTYSPEFPVIFTAMQSQTVRQYADGNVCECTTPLMDDTMTVIDGGHITTGTIDARNVSVTHIKADSIDSGFIGDQEGAFYLDFDRNIFHIGTGAQVGSGEVSTTMDGLLTDLSAAKEAAASAASFIETLQGEQTIDNINKSISSLNEGISAINKQLVVIDKKADDAGKVATNYLTFTDGTLYIGTDVSNIRSALTNDLFSFQTDAGNICYFGLNDQSIWEMFIQTASVQDRLSFGKFSWITRQNGNMTLKWVGATDE